MAAAKKAHYVADVDYSTDPLAEPEDRHLEYDEAFSQDEELAVPTVVVPSTAVLFAYDLGHRVQPEPHVPARTVIWRGQLKERRSDTGLVHRVNVYRLDDGFWDCYREDELQAA